MKDKINASPLGGDLWSVSFPQTDLERILGLPGEIIRVKAKNEKEAKEKAFKIWSKEHGKKNA